MNIESMNHCCSTENTKKEHAVNQTVICPVCKQKMARVGSLTLLHQLKYPLNASLDQDYYHYCKNEACDVIYFDSSKARVYNSDDLRKHILKPGNTNRLICHCFGITEKAFQQVDKNKQKGIFDFVKKQTRLGNCACEINHPSGLCCLGSFKKIDR